MSVSLTWMDVVSTDYDRAVRFYHEVFGWTEHSLEVDGPAYSLFRSAGEPVAGVEAIPGDGSKGAPRWTIIAQADDLDALAAAAPAAGGRVAVAPVDLGTEGRIAMIEDPAGTTVGLWRPGTLDPAAATPRTGRIAGAELAATEPAALLPFYREVLGWTVVETTDNCHVLDAGAVRVRIRSAQQPSDWIPILQVHDLDGTARHIEAAGGRVRLAGEVLSAVDPTGASFLLTDRQAR